MENAQEVEQEIVYRVKDNPDFIKDDITGAILNTNHSKLKEYKLRKQQNNKISKLQEEVNELKTLLKMVLEEKKCQ